MTRPIRNTGLCFPSGLPRQRGQRDVLSHTEFYTPIFCMLSVFQAIPFELPRKPPTVNRWDSTLGTPGGDKYYNQYRPQCEVCPRDHGKVVESLQSWEILNLQPLDLQSDMYLQSDKLLTRLRPPVHCLLLP